MNISSWDLYYRNINRCNVFLSRIATATVPSEQDRLRWTAEARVLRAFYYMELMMRFGDIPLLTDPTPLEYSNELLKNHPLRQLLILLYQNVGMLLKILVNCLGELQLLLNQNV